MIIRIRLTAAAARLTVASASRPLVCSRSLSLAPSTPLRPTPAHLGSLARPLSTTSVRRHEKSPADEHRSKPSDASFKGKLPDIRYHYQPTRPRRRLNSAIDPITRYDHLIDTGVLKADEHQRTIIKKLQRLWTDLKDYEPGELPPQSEQIQPSFVSLFPSNLAGCRTHQERT